jgi:hypothetical protein
VIEFCGEAAARLLQNLANQEKIFIPGAHKQDAQGGQCWFGSSRHEKAPLSLSEFDENHIGRLARGPRRLNLKFPKLDRDRE